MGAQGTPSRSSPSMRSLASSPMHWLGRRRSMAASPGRAPALGVRRSIDPQPSAQPPHAPLRRAVTEAPQQLSLAVAEAGRWEPPPLPDWRSAWQELVPEKSDSDAEIVYRAEYRPTAAEMPASPFVSPREQEPERKPAASAAAAAGGRRPPRPSSTTASPTPSAPATPRRAAAPMTVPGSSPPGDARRWPADAPVSASPPRPAMLPRHSTGAVRLAAAAHLEELPRRHSAAYVSSPAALPPLAVRTSVILGDAPPPSSVPSTPAASRRPPLLRQVSHLFYPTPSLGMTPFSSACCNFWHACPRSESDGFIGVLMQKAVNFWKPSCSKANKRVGCAEDGGFVADGGGVGSVSG